MRRCVFALAGTLAALSCAAQPAPVSAQSGPPKKPVPAGVKGTSQLPGTVGQLGVTYTLKQGGTAAFNLTVKSLSFVASRMPYNGTTVFPDGDKRFLVVDYTIQNPNSSDEYLARSDDFTLTAVDALNQNYNGDQSAMNTTTGSDLNISLKPGQKVEGRTYIAVPAQTLVPKVILAWGDGDKVMRFDLHGVVRPVEPLLHDPADKTGTLSLSTVSPALIGTTYPVGQFDITMVKFERIGTPLQGNPPDDGKEYLVATVRVKNPMNKDDVDFNNANGLTATVLDADGDKIDRNGDYLKISADEAADTSIPVGIEKQFRLYWIVSKGSALKTVTLNEGDSYRKLVYDISAVH